MQLQKNCDPICFFYVWLIILCQSIDISETIACMAILLCYRKITRAFMNIWMYLIFVVTLQKLAVVEFLELAMLRMIQITQMHNAHTTFYKYLFFLSIFISLSSASVLVRWYVLERWYVSPFPTKSFLILEKKLLVQNTIFIIQETTREKCLHLPWVWIIISV